MTDIPDDLDDEEIDADIQLIGDYLARHLSDAESEAVEDRMANDEAFFEKISPILKVWTMPVSFRQRLAEREAREGGEAEPVVEAEQGRAMGARSSRSMPLSLRELEELYPRTPRTTAVAEQMPGPAPVHLPSSSPGSPRRKRLPSVSGRTRFILEIAAVLVALVAPPAVRYVNFLRHSDAIAASTGGLTSLKLESGSKAETGPGETRVFALDDFSSVLLRPGSRFVYRVALFGPTVLATLDGEAVITVSTETRVMLIGTSAGSVTLTRGQYAVRCSAGCDELLLTTGRGAAILRSENPRKILQIRTGEHGRLPKGGQPEATAGGDGYPALTLPRRETP